MATKRTAQMWDKMQFLFRNYYDRMIHISTIQEGEINVDAFKKAVDILLFKIDILRCKFHPNPIRPYWILTEKYNLDDCVSVVEVEDIENAQLKFLSQMIPFDSELQMRVQVQLGKEQFGFSILLNHMCCDGGDSKYLMSKLTELYADIVSGGDGTKISIKQGTRENRQLYDRMPPEKAKVAKKLYKNISQSKVKVEFPFTLVDGSEYIRLFKTKLDESIVNEINIVRKQNNATINDVLLTAFFRLVYQYLGGTVNKMNIISMMDLRRYCGGETLGVTNMTGFAPCEISVEDESFIDTLAKVKRVMEKNKMDEYMGLYSLPLLKLAFTVFPHAISEIAIKIGYQNPLIGMSNIGIVDRTKFELKGANLIDAFMTGASKYKPYMQLTTTTFDNTMTFCIAEKCNDKDAVILNQFLVDYKKELLNFCALKK